ncbi:hypothetical protein STEG23_001838 [Scotinomys teguina]
MRSSGGSEEDSTTSNNQEYSTDLGSESSLLEAETLYSQYAVSKTIGHGVNGEVKLAHHRLTGTQVAVKVLQKKRLWGHPVSSEVDIMMIINHPNIISLVQVIESEKSTYLIMELVKGQELYGYVQEAGHLEDDARGIFTQILNAMSYRHDRGIIHRDLKPDNVMVNGSRKVQIIDFGLSTQVKPGQKLSFRCGAYQFGPLEFFLERFYNSPKVNIWALGVVLYFMVVGRLPFQIVEGKDAVPLGLSEELHDLLECLMTADHRLRPIVYEVIAHPWLKDTEASESEGEQMVPSLPDPNIVQAMHCIGFETQNIEESVHEKEFNQTMACCYLF